MELIHQNLGSLGEHLVMSLLGSRCRYVGHIRQTPQRDIDWSGPGGKTIPIKVRCTGRTSRRSERGFEFSIHAPLAEGDTPVVYVLVALADLDCPRYWVIPTPPSCTAYLRISDSFTNGNLLQEKILQVFDRF